MTFILLVTAFLIVPAAFGQIDESELFSNYNEHIDCYEKAYASIKKAFEICTRNVGALTQKSASDLTPQERSSVGNLKQLRSHYLRQMQAILKKMAAAYDKLTQLRYQQNQLEEAAQYCQLSAKQWEKIAALYQQEVSIILETKDYFAAAQQYEKIFQAYKAAQGKWKLYADIEHSVQKLNESGQTCGEYDTDDNIKRTYYSGIDALNEAADAYQAANRRNQIQAANETVNQSTINRNVGSHWLKAASALENYERVAKIIQELEGNTCETFYLDDSL